MNGQRKSATGPRFIAKGEEETYRVTRQLAMCDLIYNTTNLRRFSRRDNAVHIVRERGT